MKTIWQLILCAALAACSYNKAVIYGVGEATSINVAGDGSTANTILGNTYVAKNSTATKAIIQGIIGLTAAIYYGNLQLEKEATQQLYNAGLSKVEVARVNAALQESLATKGYEATEAAIKGGLFTPVPFKQP